MAEPSPEFRRVGSGCGVQGCLFAAVALFVLLLIGVLVIGVFRFSEPPQGVRMPAGMSSAVGRQSSVDPGPPTDERRPTPGEERRGEAHA